MTWRKGGTKRVRWRKEVRKQAGRMEEKAEEGR